MAAGAGMATGTRGGRTGGRSTGDPPPPSKASSPASMSPLCALALAVAAARRSQRAAAVFLSPVTPPLALSYSPTRLRPFAAALASACLSRSGRAREYRDVLDGLLHRLRRRRVASFGLTHMAVTMLDLVKCNMQGQKRDAGVMYQPQTQAFMCFPRRGRNLGRTVNCLGEGKCAVPELRTITEVGEEARFVCDDAGGCAGERARPRLHFAGAAGKAASWTIRYSAMCFALPATNT